MLKLLIIFFNPRPNRGGSPKVECATFDLAYLSSRNQRLVNRSEGIRIQGKAVI